MQDGGANNIPNPEVELAGQELRAALEQFGDDKKAKQEYAESQFKLKFEKLPQVSGNEAEFKPLYEDLSILRDEMGPVRVGKVEMALSPQSSPDAPEVKIFDNLREQKSADEAFAAMQPPVTPALPPLPTSQREASVHVNFSEAAGQTQAQTEPQSSPPPRPTSATPSDLKLSGANAKIDNVLSAANNSKKLNVIYYDTGNQNFVGSVAFDQIRANNAKAGNKKVLYVFGENDSDYDLSKTSPNTQRDGSGGQAKMLNGRTYAQIDEGAVGIVSTMYKNDTPEALQAKLQESLQAAADRAKNEGAALLVPAKFDAQGNLLEIDIGTGIAMDRDAMKNYKNADGQTGPAAFQSDLQRGLEQISKGKDVDLSVKRTQGQAQTQTQQQPKGQQQQATPSAQQQGQSTGENQGQGQGQAEQQGPQEAPPQKQGMGKGDKAKFIGTAALAAVGLVLMAMAPGLGLLMLLLTVVVGVASVASASKHNTQRSEIYNNEVKAFTARQEGHNLQKQQNLSTSMQQTGMGGPERGDVPGMGQGGYAAAVMGTNQTQQQQATRSGGPERGDVPGMGQGGSAFIPSQIANNKPLPQIPDAARAAAQAAAATSGLSGATRTSGTVAPAETPENKSRPAPSVGRGSGGA